MGMPDQAVPIRIKVRGTDAIQWKENFVFQVSMDMECCGIQTLSIDSALIAIGLCPTCPQDPFSYAPIYRNVPTHLVLSHTPRASEFCFPYTKYSPLK